MLLISFDYFQDLVFYFLLLVTIYGLWFDFVIPLIPWTTFGLVFTGVVCGCLNYFAYTFE
jgi:hypothetical protein